LGAYEDAVCRAPHSFTHLEHLTKAQAKAYMLADNKLTDCSSWNNRELALHLKELSDLVFDFEIEATGFEPPEIDLRIQSLDPPEVADEADEFAEFAEEITIIENETKRRGPVFEAILLQLWRQEMSGSRYATRMRLKYQRFVARETGAQNYS
jgi:hypothetical protein